MSILIQGVDMPRHCDECPMRRFNLAMCQVTGKSTSHHPTGKPMKPGVRPKWCPLAEAPGWIPVTERLPEDGFYICTLDGELCGESKPLTGLCGIEKGVWDEPDMVSAWMPLPMPYEEGAR